MGVILRITIAGKTRNRRIAFQGTNDAKPEGFRVQRPALAMAELLPEFQQSTSYGGSKNLTYSPSN